MESYEYAESASTVRVVLAKELVDPDKHIVMYLGSDDELTEMFENDFKRESVLEVMPALRANRRSP